MNKENDERDILVEKYFNGTLTPDEGAALEAQINGDPEFAKLFALEKEIHRQKNTPSEKARKALRQKDKRTSTKWIIAGIAASTIGFTLFTLFPSKPAHLVPDKPIENDTTNTTKLQPIVEDSTIQLPDVQSKSQKTHPPMASIDPARLKAFIKPLSDFDQTKSNSASIFYSKQDYNKFIELMPSELESLSGSKKRDEILKLGSAHMILGQNKQAINYFQILLADDLAIRYHLESNYQMAIATLMQGNIDSGIKILDSIKNSRKESEVKEILKLITYN